MPKHVELTKKRQDIYINYSANKNIINITNISNITNITNITNIIKITNITNISNITNIIKITNIINIITIINIIDIIIIIKRSKLKGAAADHLTLNFYSLAFHANNSPPLKFEFPRKILTFVALVRLSLAFSTGLFVQSLGLLSIKSELGIVRIDRMFLLLFVSNELSPFSSI